MFIWIIYKHNRQIPLTTRYASLTWRLYIDKNVAQSRLRSPALLTFRIDLYCKRLHYKQINRTTWTYCLQIWDCTAKFYFDKIQARQNLILRAIVKTQTIWTEFGLTNPTKSWRYTWERNKSTLVWASCHNQKCTRFTQFSNHHWVIGTSLNVYKANRRLWLRNVDSHHEI